MSGKADLTETGTITLKINNISAYMRRIGKNTESPPLQVAGIGWLLFAYPSVVDETTCLSCFLAGENASKWTAWVDATFRIVMQNGGGFGKERSFHTALFGQEPLKQSLGWQVFVTSQELLNAASGFVAHDSVEIRVDLRITDVCGASVNVFETAGALVADIKLKVGESVFYANKGYLSVMSSVFRDMFAFTEAEDAKTELDKVELQDLDANDFKEFLGVIYPTRYPVTDANVTSLLRLAVRYDVKHAIAECERHLLDTNKVAWSDKLKLAIDLHREDLRNQLVATMTLDDVKAFQLAEDRDEWGMDVVLAVVERHKLLSAATDFVGMDISGEADISVTDVCGAFLDAFETAGALVADIKLKVSDSVFYANKGYLSVLSSVFHDMFAFTDADDAKMDMAEIELKDLDASEFKEFLGVIYPTPYPITDANVISLFRIADRFDVKRVVVDCESHLSGANRLPLFDKLKLAVDLSRYQLKDRLIRKMTWDDFEIVDRNDRKDQLRMDVLQTLIDEHIRVCRP